jgi:hypothetical protein
MGSALIEEAVRFTREALQDSQNLRKVSWQGICSFMKKNEKFGWLTDAINEKYGIDRTEVR